MNPLAKLYGGSSARHHLKLNADIAAISAGFVGAFCIWAGAASPWLAAPLGVWAMERWASPDRDLQENRTVRGWWEWYGDRVKHRSRWSHSLLFGTPIRLLYGFAPVVLLLPFFASRVGCFVLGCVVSDLAHYALDINQEWGLREAMIGR